MKRAIAALALAGSILILTGIATPALAADIQGGEPSVSTQTPTGTQTTPTPAGTTMETTSAPDPNQPKSPISTSTADTPSGDPSTATSQPTDNQAIGSTTAPSSEPSASSSTQSKTVGQGHTPVTLCHKPGTPAEHTLTVDDDAVPAHLAHGDYLGECKDSTPTPTPTPTITVEPPTGPPPVGVDSTTSVSYDCTTGMVTKTLTETPYTWSRNQDGTYTKVPGTPVVTKTVRPIDPEEYTCPVNTSTPTPEPTQPTPVQSEAPTVPTPSGTTLTDQAPAATGHSEAQSIGSNPRTALADTGSDTSGTIPAAGITLVMIGAICLVTAILLKRRRSE